MWRFGRGASAPQAHRDGLPPLQTRYAVIDTELTGLDEKRDSIVSVGALRVTQGRIDLADRFYEEARPTSALSAESILVHGITPDQASGRREIDAVIIAFAAWCADDILVGHFITIDLLFLRKEARHAGLGPPTNRVVDTCALYDWLSGRPPVAGGPGLHRLRDPRLPELAQLLGVPCSGGHHALDDAFVTAQVFQRLLHLLPRWGIGTTADLLRAGNPRGMREHHHGSLPLA
jgi:DNA polymerase-3 subunit epsilon